VDRGGQAAPARGPRRPLRLHGGPEVGRGYDRGAGQDRAGAGVEGAGNDFMNLHFRPKVLRLF
jgi:hypothetical protein